MKTHRTLQRLAIRVTGLSFLIAILAAGTVLYAQQPPAATPAPVTPPKAQPVADEPATGPRRTGRIPVPEKEAPAAVPNVPPADPAAAQVVDSVTAPPRTKTIVREEKDANGFTRKIVSTILDEELSSNPQEAARNYEAVIAAFDSQRENAAQAIFRLGETYRKLNRLDEARVQYARILREFVDFPDLAALSQKQLSQNPPAVPTGGGGTVGGSLSEFAGRAAAGERALLLQEIELLENQLSETQQLVKTGVAATDSVIPIQREILQLKRQLLRNGNGSDAAPSPKKP